MDDISGRDMERIPDLSRYEKDPAFHEFVDREFDQMASQAPLEDLAIFAFGGIREAIEAYEEYKQGQGGADIP